MASLGMLYGPHPFVRATIVNEVRSNRMGNYALGIQSQQGDFTPYYVGRSDSDLQAELIGRLPSSNTRTHFKFSYASTVREAFEKECQNFHAFQKQLENDIHPAKPQNTNFECPVCGQ